MILAFCSELVKIGSASISSPWPYDIILCVCSMTSLNVSLVLFRNFNLLMHCMMLGFKECVCSSGSCQMCETNSFW